MVRIISLDRAPMTELTRFGRLDPDEGDCVGTIALPVRDHINAATVTSLLHTDWSFIPPDKVVDRSIMQGSILTIQRNECVQRMRGDWLLFIDDDMAWEPDAIKRLVEARDEIDADMIGALCYRRSAPFQPTLYMREREDSGGYNFLESWKDDIIEVDATGMAFILIHKRVFEAMGGPMPPLEERRSGPPPNFFRWEGVLGEDLRFCQDAKAAGARIWVDTRIEVGHIAEIEIRRKHFLLEMLDRDAETMIARRAVNDMMGLPTMEADEIKRRLGWDD